MQLGNWWSLTAGRLNAREERADWASSQSLTSALQLSPRAELIPARWPLPFNPPIPLMPQVTSVAPYRCHGAATEFSCSPLQPFFIRRLPSLPCMLEKSRCLLLPGGLIMSVWPPLTCQDICTCAVDPTALAPWGKGWKSYVTPWLEIKLEGMPQVSSFGVGCRCIERFGEVKEEAAQKKLA